MDGRDFVLTRTVFIPAAGLGSRFKRAGFNIPKPLATVNGLPVLAQIINLYPPDWRIVVALGYAADLIEECLKGIFHDLPRSKNLLFCYTKSHTSAKTGLTNTILDAQETLNDEPFVFHASDSYIITENKTWLSWLKRRNQILVSRPQGTGNYRLLRSNADGNLEWDQMSSQLPLMTREVYIGVAHIFETCDFWERLRDQGPASPEAGECLGLEPTGLEVVSLRPGVWHDTGSFDSYGELVKQARHRHQILQKPEESIWFTKSRVIKMHMDTAFIEGRVARAQALRPFVPNILESGSHTYAYSYIEGDTLSQKMETNPQIFKDFLAFLRYFWFELPSSGASSTRERRTENDFLYFYRDKTYSRIKQLLSRFPDLDQKMKINGRETPPLFDQLDLIDWHALSAPLWGRVHGDLHTENVVVTSKGDFLLIDWRQDIAGSLDALGDVYYDLAKLAHSLRLDHSLILEGNYEVAKDDFGKFSYNLPQTPNKAAMYLHFQNFCKKEQFSWRRVQVLEALIYLNIAPLHDPPKYSRLLALMGRDLLNSLHDVNVLNPATVI